MAENRKIFICATVKNRFKNLRRLCKSISEIKDMENVHFSVSDYESTDGDYRELLGTQDFPTSHVLLQEAPFNRSQGLNYALMPLKPSREDLVFFVDVDMLVPDDLTEQMRTIVQEGVCWFPICYSLHKGKPAKILRNSKHGHRANGWWRVEGKGMCGFVVGDFLDIGKWHERVGVTYGKEDGLIARRSVNHGLKMVRKRCVGLYHVWHPTGSYRTKHHMKAKTKPGRGKRKGRINPHAPQPKIELWHSVCPDESES